MLQKLLVERFQLKVNKETRTLPVYELVVARNGPKLKESKGESGATSHTSNGGEGHGSSGHARNRSMTMQELARMLEANVGRTVINKTGLPGKYEITLRWRPEPGQSPAAEHMSGREGQQSAADPSLPSIFTAVQEQLGLKLESGKGPVPVIVIESAQKPRS